MPNPAGNPAVTVVTGGSRGIGAATARRLAAAGHDVVIAYRQADSAAHDVAEAIRSCGRRALAVRVDVAVEADVVQLFDEAATLGPITGLVNNAGVTSPLGRLVDLRAADLHRVLAVNVAGYAMCAQQAVRRMSTRTGGMGGAIVNVSSAAATLGSPGECVHYAAAKAAVDTLTVGLAREVAPDGVRVNSVQPGLTLTEIHAASGDAGRPARLAGQVPLGRPAEPDEVAAPICWLLSAEASYTTGAVLRVAGGM
jgi:NAD(P)-dependent dehydrogenase (short-subunit alcohol dehydrogenase family)